MPKSLRVKLGGLRYKGILEDKDYKRLCKALDNEDVLEKIRAEIESQREKVSKKHSEDEGLTNYYFGLNDGLKDARDIIDKYKAESEDKK